MAERFNIGDLVSWNSEAGQVSGTIVAVHTRDFDYKGYITPPRRSPGTRSGATRPTTSRPIRAARWRGSAADGPGSLSPSAPSAIRP